ncbi:hypothetical protein [Vibrio navarrensis]|uniref:Uncharacterized protein n=1 Tax=Vibrio navarrensis TaxID=29495 RepID=A0AAJ4LT77_9VIBR|nr:hypothetical protein [Vibrio navarrensis]QPL52435.1 hypothetical protein I3X05_10430 [Vibrio navarrensis]
MTHKTLQGSVALDEWRKLYNIEKFKQEENKQRAANAPIARKKTQHKSNAPAFSY